MDDDDLPLSVEFVHDPILKDCADFLASRMVRKYRHATSTMIFLNSDTEDSESVVMRPLVKFTLPAGYDLDAFDQDVFDLQEQIFWKHGILVAYSIEHEAEEQHDES